LEGGQELLCVANLARAPVVEAVGGLDENTPNKVRRIGEREGFPISFFPDIDSKQRYAYKNRIGCVLRRGSVSVSADCGLGDYGRWLDRLFLHDDAARWNCLGVYAEDSVVAGGRTNSGVS
jgi:hypothetical protein